MVTTNPNHAKRTDFKIRHPGIITGRTVVEVALKFNPNSKSVITRPTNIQEQKPWETIITPWAPTFYVLKTTLKIQITIIKKH